MSFGKFIAIEVGCILGSVGGLGVVLWARSILYEYKREFLSDPGLRMLQDITMAALFDGHTLAAGAVALWLIGWALIIGCLLGGALIVLYGLYEWGCSWSPWVRAWWDGACVRLFSAGV